jgi:hypothetical protein
MVIEDIDIANDAVAEGRPGSSSLNNLEIGLTDSS